MCSSVNDKDKRFACLYGMILFSREITPEHICFQTESRISADMFSKLLHSVFGSSVCAARSEKMRKSGQILYCCDISGAENAGAVLKAYRINPEQRRITPDIIVNNSHGVFMAGVFLACGSVNDPAKEYHLEFTVPEEELSEELVNLLRDIGVHAKTMVRRGKYIVYVKGSESIEDTLTFIGAQQCTLELMNVKIFKDVRNKANRIANCDNANIDKVITASLRQTEDIRLIEQTIGIDKLPEELREIAELRLSAADMSLKEIGDALEPPISRSGVNHRFRRIAKIAEEIRCGGVKADEA
ncbi:MAG: DNA-binding protein WhiA [Ruminococcus sp.]|nr:DNA-binding protein WhiA [Ruminococcus sp.]